MRMTIKKERPTISSKCEKLQPLNFSALLKQKFGNNTSRKTENKRIPASILDIINSLTFPCCGQNLLPINQSNKKIIDLYIMPCGHNMCQKCLRTIIEFKRNDTISCKFLFIKGSNRDCTRTYYTQEADQLFIKNVLVKSFLQKFCFIKSEFTKNKNQEETIKKSKNQRQMVDLRNNKQKKVHFEQKQVEIDQNKTSQSSSSSQEVFNPCVNIFCKKPTLGLFCSRQCQNLQDCLEYVAFPIVNNSESKI